MAYEVLSSCFAIQLLRAVDCDLEVTAEEAIRRAELSRDPPARIPGVSRDEVREAVLFLLLQSNLCGYGDLEWLEDALNHIRLEPVLRLMLTHGSVYLNDEGCNWDPEVSGEDGRGAATDGRPETGRLNDRLRALLCRRPVPGRDEIRRFLDRL